MELARKLGLAALASGVLLIAGAICSQATGTDMQSAAGSTVNSHTTVTWVLGALGVVLLIHAVTLIAWANEQVWARRREGRRTAE